MKPRQTVKNYPNSNVPPYQHQNLPMPPPPPTASSSLSDLDLAKLGMSREDMPGLHQPPQPLPPSLPSMNTNFSSQEDLLKCIQAFYSKNNADILQKLPSMSADRPMPSLSPPEFQRMIGGGGGTAGNASGGRNSSACGGVGGSGTNFGNNNTSGLQKHDTHFVNSNSHSHQAPANVNQFRMSQPQQQTPQQKSVLSLHQYHQQNDLSNRRLNRHHMSTTSASFSNLASANAATSSYSSSNADTNNLAAIGGGSINHRSSIPTGVGTSNSNIIDTFNSIDNMLYDGNLPISKDVSSTNQQQLIRHLLKATGGQLNSSSNVPSQPASRNDSHSARNINSNNMPLSQMQATSSTANTISPPQGAFSSVPKSLLNLAACSSSPSPSAGPTLLSASKIASINHLSLLSARGQNNVSINQSGQQASTASGTNGNKLFKGTNNNNNHFGAGGETSLLKPTTNVTTNTPAQGWSNNLNNLKQLQMSLLSDPKTQGSQNLRTVSAPKDTLLVNLQERAARAGVSIGETSKPGQQASQASSNSVNSILTTSQTPQPIPSPSNQLDEDPLDRSEIESAISRVEARNDLSLLYPPMLLASNSQRQINALSAGLQGTGESEFFTKEVRRIVLEECNIIYECKECNNLFRSLANLVKHKRTYCTERASNRNDATPKDHASFNISRINSEAQQVNASTEKSSSVTLRSLRDRKDQQQQPELLKAKLQSPNHGNQPSNAQNSQTSLSRLLQTQPKNRLPTNKDSALLGALKMTQDHANVYTLNDVNEKLVQNSSLAKTLLSEKVKSGANIAQSLIELSKAESMQQPVAAKRVNPKRKFLEDCINKVKRSVSDNKTNPVGPNDHESDSQVIADKSINMSPSESDTDSETLIPFQFKKYQPEQSQKNCRRLGNAASSNASPAASAKLNTSSALLKALTRPVDNNKSRTFDSRAVVNDDDKTDNTELERSDPQREEFKPNGDSLEEAHSSEQQRAPSPLLSTYSCIICNIDFKDLTSMMDHTLEKHKKEKVVYPCIFCSLSFIALENVCRHIIDIHQKPKSQIHRLSDVVLSRSYVSPDFAVCSDYRSNTDQSEAKDVDHCDEMDVEVCEPIAKDDKKVEETGDPVVNEDEIDVDDSERKQTKAQSNKQTNDVETSHGKNIRADDLNTENDDDADSEVESEASDNMEVSSRSEGNGNYDEDQAESLDNEKVGSFSPSSAELNFSEDSNKLEDPVGPQEAECSQLNNTDQAERGWFSSSSSSDSSSSSETSSSSGSASPGSTHDDEDVDNDDDVDEEKLTTTSRTKSVETFPDGDQPSTSGARRRTSSTSREYKKSRGSSEEASASSESEVDMDKELDDADEPKRSAQHSESSAHSADRRGSTSNRSTLEPNPSSSSSGLMKLKITLKTRPDDKSTVYEIV